MVRRVASLIALLAAAPSPSAAQPATCSGTLDGAVKATFECTVSLERSRQGKAVTLVISPVGAVTGVRSFQPARFDIPEPISVKTYRLDTLGPGRSRLETARGKVFSATRSKATRGDVELSLDTVERERSASGGYTVSGTLHARLAAGGARADPVILDVTF